VGLKRLPQPPPIYQLGAWPLGPERAIALVGTRRPTRRGMELTAVLAEMLGEAGFGIVSGLARGIDTAAHAAALRTGRLTAAVLGCGLDTVYPKGNKALMRAIADRGALISEYPPGTPPLRGNFPKRNRLIAALTQAVIVMEAGAQSGALHTAVYARRLGIPVWVPYALASGEQGMGLSRLLRSGARGFHSCSELVNRLASPTKGENPADAGSPSTLSSTLATAHSSPREAERPAHEAVRVIEAKPPVLRRLAITPEGLGAEDLYLAWQQEMIAEPSSGSPSLAASKWRWQILQWQLKGWLVQGRDGRYYGKPDELMVC